MAVNGIDGAKYMLTQLGTSYGVADCVKAAVVNVIRNCPGGDKSYKTGGCTELWNSLNSSGKYHHIIQRLTLAEAKAEGLLIGDLPVIYDSATGKCEHIAYYMGGIGGFECIHSSASKGEVCGTFLKNGFTHVLRHRDIKGVRMVDSVPDAGNEVHSMSVLYNARVNTSGGGALNLRASSSSTAKVLAQIPFGVSVGVIEETSASWLKVEYAGKIGYVSRPLVKRDEDTEPIIQNVSVPGEGSLIWGVFIPCNGEGQAAELADLLGGGCACQRVVND